MIPRNDFEEMIERLPERQQLALHLMGSGQLYIAREMGISVDAVKKLLHKARFNVALLYFEYWLIRDIAGIDAGTDIYA